MLVGFNILIRVLFKCCSLVFSVVIFIFVVLCFVKIRFLICCIFLNFFIVRFVILFCSFLYIFIIVLFVVFFNLESFEFNWFNFKKIVLFVFLFWILWFCWVVVKNWMEFFKFFNYVLMVWNLVWLLIFISVCWDFRVWIFCFWFWSRILRLNIFCIRYEMVVFLFGGVRVLFCVGCLGIKKLI